MISATEVALRAVGTALAALSMAFAVYMLAYADHKPRINGVEYLAIFAQPRGAAHLAKGAELPLAKESPPPLPLSQVDMTATGSLASGPATNSAPRPVEMIAARADRVWLLIDGAIRAAAAGDDVPRLGHIARIVEGEAEWALLDDKGATLLSMKKRANGAPLFSKQMIFR